MPIHVLLAQMPRMMRDILSSALDAEPDMRVVGGIADAAEPADAAGLARHVADEQPDVVIVGGDDAGAAAACDALLYRHPRLTVLVLGERGRQVTLCEMRPARTALGEIAPAQLVDAIRRSVGAGRAGAAAGARGRREAEDA